MRPSSFGLTNAFDTRVPAVDRALRLLELLAFADHSLTLSEISRSLGIPNSSGHDLIQALAIRGYVQKCPETRSYTLGLRAFDFAKIDVADVYFRATCQPHIQELSSKLMLTTQAAVLRHGQGVVVAKADPATGPWRATWVGRHFDLHCNALGKAIIAYLPDDELERLFRGRALIRYTPRTMYSPEALKAHLAEVRAKGFAVNDEECAIGVRGIAAPILNHIRRVVASVGVSGVPEQIPAWRIPYLSRELIRAARDISRHLSSSQ